jgi:SAM-dependent methyltransferase
LKRPVLQPLQHSSGHAYNQQGKELRYAPRRIDKMVTPQQPPLPPVELRRLVGPTDDCWYDNLAGKPIFPEIPPEAYDHVFDFGCGCGRLARQLIQQHQPPRRYTGVDLHRGMIQWCQQNLVPYNEGFEFYHHDVRNLGFNPEGSAETFPFPVDDRVVTLFIAWSVFTHVNEVAAEFYLNEISRVLHPDGTAVTTWFLFDKADFPMMQEFQNALFINDVDPTNAVIFDKGWLQRMADQAGLVLKQVVPPMIRGFQWRVYLGAARPGSTHIPFPKDVAPRGIERPPVTPESAEKLGVERQD